MPRPILVVRASIDPTVMDEFLAWYRKVHLPHVMAIPGMVNAYRADCRRRGVNWAALYELAEDASVQAAISSPQADTARRDWERWLPYASDVSVEVYAALGPVATFHHWN